jgi:hypothetical protein
MTNTMRSGFVAAALLAVPALLAAQSHIPATTPGITVAGVFLPATKSGNFVVARSQDGSIQVSLRGGASIPAPTPPPGAPTNMALLVSANQGNSVSLVTSTIANSGVGVEASRALVDALTGLSGGTALAAVNSINAWNAAVRDMSGPQLQALLSTPEGVAAVRMMNAAAAAVLRPPARQNLQEIKSSLTGRKAPSA